LLYCAKFRRRPRNRDPKAAPATSHHPAAQKDFVDGKVEYPATPIVNDGIEAQIELSEWRLTGSR